MLTRIFSLILLLACLTSLYGNASPHQKLPNVEYSILTPSFVPSVNKGHSVAVQLRLDHPGLKLKNAIVGAKSPYGKILLHQTVCGKHHSNCHMIKVKRITLHSKGITSLGRKTFHLMLTDATKTIHHGSIPITLYFSDKTSMSIKLHVMA